MKPTLTLITALLLASLADVLPAADAVANGAAPPEILAPDELALVRELATATLETCGVPPGAIAHGKTNTLGFRAITPGGYPAIWIQDFTMNFSSGLISREEGLQHFQLILEKQNGAEPRDLGQQVVIPAHAIPDHINVDGTPVFFPGTYDPSANMNGDWGFRPPSNNQFDVIWLAHMLARSGDAKALLSREVGGRTAYERLKLAFAVPEIDPATQLVRTTAARRAVGFIFYDAIEMTGDLLMASLIRYRAALHLAWLATKMDQPEDAKHYADVAQQIRSHILPVFADTDGTHGGWLKASNGLSGQSDVWGSIYAIYIGAVEGEARAALLRTITAALAKPGEIEFEGALRHVPLSGDASPTTMWEKTRYPKNRYENGAYWHIPVGWLLTILQPGHPELAQTVKLHWLGHLRAQQGKVWECIGWDGQANKNPSYGTSIALPLGVLSRGELRADRLAALLATLHAAEPKVFDITAHGAKGDGTTLNTQMIQQAVDTCHEAGGGVVSVPKGVFLTGSLRLKSGVVLRIEKDAILRGSSKIADYALETAELHWFDAQDRLNMFKSINTQHRPALIYAEDAEQVRLEGSGVIDGQGGVASKIFPNQGDPQRRIPMLIRFERCRDVKLSGLTLIDPAMFATFFARCTDIQIERITVRSRDSAAYGNAFVLAGSRRVSIKDCDADCKDDCIALQTFHPDWPNEDIEISGCRLTTRWCAIRIGAESFGATRRLTMRGCTFTDCQGGIKIESSGGQTHEDLSFSNIEMTKVCQPIMVLASRFAFSKHHQTRRPPIGHIRNVRFEHIKAVVGDGGILRSKSGWEAPYKRYCSAVVSGPGSRIEDISFYDIDITFPGGGTAEQAARLDVGELLEAFEYLKWAVPFDGELPGSALYLRHVKGVRLENVRYAVEKPDARAFIAGDDVQGLTLQGVVGRAPAPVPGLAKLADAKNVTDKDCRVECGTSVPVLIAPTTEELRRLAELRTRSAALDREIQQKADQFDVEAKKDSQTK